MSENVETVPEWGWRILDPEGNVIASGPLIEVEGLADNSEQEEND